MQEVFPCKVPSARDKESGLNPQRQSAFSMKATVLIVLEEETGDLVGQLHALEVAFAGMWGRSLEV